MQNDYISREEFIKAVCEDCGVEADVSPCDLVECYIRNKLMAFPAADAVVVVRCKDCKHGVWDKNEEMYMCVESAEYDPELGVFCGFVSPEAADFFCARGELRGGNDE